MSFEEPTPSAEEVSEQLCLNCGKIVPATYCSSCGQAHESLDFSVKALLKTWWKKKRHHFEVFIFTSRELLIRPNVVLEEYWAGKKKKYYNPFNYFVLIGSVMTFLMLQFGNYDPEIAAQNVDNMYKAMGIEMPDNPGGMMAMQWMQGHFNLVLMLTVPFYAMGVRFLFRKRGYKLGEMLILILYSMALYMIFVMPLIPFLNYNNPFNSPVSILNFGLLFGLWSWTITKTMKIPWWKGILSTIMVYLLGQVFLVGFIFALTVVAVLLILAFVMVRKLVGA